MGFGNFLNAARVRRRNSSRKLERKICGRGDGMSSSGRGAYKTLPFSHLHRMNWAWGLAYKLGVGTLTSV